MVDDKTISQVRAKYQALAPIMNEKMRRHWAASEAIAIGWGGISAVARATGLSQTTIQAGIKELQQPSLLANDPDAEARLRRPGAGRKALQETDRRLKRDLEKLPEASTLGSPTSPLRCGHPRVAANSLMNWRARDIRSATGL